MANCASQVLHLSQSQTFSFRDFEEGFLILSVFFCSTHNPQSFLGQEINVRLATLGECLLLIVIKDISKMARRTAAIEVSIVFLTPLSIEFLMN